MPAQITAHLIRFFAATTTIWHYFIAFRIHGISPVATILLWECIGIKFGFLFFFFYKITMPPSNPASAVTRPPAKLSGNQTTPWRWGPSLRNQPTPDRRECYFQTYTNTLLPPGINCHVLLGSFCHDSATKIKQERPLQGQDPIHRLGGKRNS